MCPGEMRYGRGWARAACGAPGGLPQELRHDAVRARREDGEHRARALWHEAVEVLRKPYEELALLEELAAEVWQRGPRRGSLRCVALSHAGLHPEAGHDEHEVGVPQEEDVLRVAPRGGEAGAPEGHAPEEELLRAEEALPVDKAAGTRHGLDEPEELPREGFLHVRQSFVSSRGGARGGGGCTAYRDHRKTQAPSEGINRMNGEGFHRN